MTNGKIKFSEKFAYGFGDLASVLYWQTFMAYILFFYTDVFGITAAAAGTMMLVTRLWDGVNDPMMGMIADRTQTKWGKFRPFLLWLCVPFAFVGVLTFTTPDLGYTGKLIWAYVTFTALMMLYTAINIPYSALLGVISSDPIERNDVSSVKFVFAYAAGTIVGATLLPMAGFFGKNNIQQGWQTSFIIYGVAAVCFFLITFTFTRERVTPIIPKRNPIKKDLSDLFSNRPWVLLLAATITFILFVAGRLTVSAHYFKYYVGEQTVNLFGHVGTYDYEWTTSAFHTVGQIASIIGVIFTAWFARQVGKKRAFLILFVIAVLSTAVLYFFKPHQLMLIYLSQIIGSFTGGPLSPLIWAMYADTADYAEWKTGRRATGLVFSASTMSQKFGWAIGGAFAGWLLFVFGFEANTVPTEQVKHGLRLLMSLIPAALGVISILIMLAYNLDEKKMKQIEAELAERKKEAGQAAEA